ncbi:MAG: PAS domain-containing protein [Verrucomicrobia bacterium]|nr:PAS domain-containing protein [Verrucomicrobiota bacterium]NBS79419.1 PAS domain-containing protein [bacterium]NBV96811.1 PAS domain-containing protein [Verrucomicrobiota bacterium]
MSIAQKPLRSSLPFLLFLCVWLVCLQLDRWEHDLSIAPFLALVSFFILSIFCSPWVVLVSIPPFAALSYHLISPLSPFSTIRTITLISGGLVASYASLLRVQAEKLAQSRGAIFSLLPIPIIISDPTSKIMDANDSAVRLLKYSKKELLDFSWFNLLLDSPKKRTEMEAYIRVGQNPMPSDLQFIFVGKDNVQHRVSLVGERVGPRVNLITTFKQNL